MVIGLNTYKEIRRLRLDGMSQRQIAERLHISRNTVKKYRNGDNVPWERKKYNRKASILTPEVVSFVQSCLEEDTHCKSGKQHHTTKRIYDRLVDERDFTGGETTVRRLVRQLKEKTAEPFVPLVFPAGDAMQIDWGEATVYIGGNKLTVNLFCARLCYSSAPIVLAYYRQNEESFLDALIKVFRYFGGVPKHVIFDNGRVAVKDGFGAHAKKQAGYTIFSAHYGFEAVFCNPASGNEKGLVEGLVGYIRRNVCVPIPKTETLEQLNEMLLDKCQKYLKHQIRGREADVGTLLETDKSHLRPLPGYAFDPRKCGFGQVDRFSTIRYDSNNYSVPVAYCGREVTVKAGPEQIFVYFEGKCIAQHKRCLGKKQNIYTLEHYLPLLEKKGRSVFYAKPVRQNLPEYFLDWLQKQNLPPRELVQMLRRCQEEGAETVMNNTPFHKAPVEIEDRVPVKSVDLSVYDTFLSGKADTAA